MQNLQAKLNDQGMAASLVVLENGARVELRFQRGEREKLVKCTIGPVTFNARLVLEDVSGAPDGTPNLRFAIHPIAAEPIAAADTAAAEAAKVAEAAAAEAAAKAAADAARAEQEAKDQAERDEAARLTKEAEDKRAADEAAKLAEEAAKAAAGDENQEPEKTAPEPEKKPDGGGGRRQR